MDVDTHIMSIEKETSQEREVGMRDKSDDVHGSEQHSYQEEEGRPKASRRRKDNSTEHVSTAGRRATEAETAGVMEQRQR